MPTNAELGARLLTDAASFFRSLADQNPAISDQMTENARVFEQMGRLLVDDPTGSFPEEGEPSTAAEEPKTTTNAFRPCPPWVAAISEERGDRLFFSDRATAPRWAPAEPAIRDELAKVLGSTADSDLERLTESALYSARLPFYEDGELIHAVATESAGSFDAFFLVYRESSGSVPERRCVVIPFTSPPILHANEHAPLLLDGAELDYLLFFMHLVGGEAGAFRVLHGRTLLAVRDILIESGNEAVAAGTAEPKLIGQTVDGSVVYQLYITYSGIVFRASLKLYPNGMTEMLDDQPLLDAPLESLREMPKAEADVD